MDSTMTYAQNLGYIVCFSIMLWLSTLPPVVIDDVKI